MSTPKDSYRRHTAARRDSAPGAETLTEWEARGGIATVCEPGPEPEPQQIRGIQRGLRGQAQTLCGLPLTSGGARRTSCRSGR